MPSDPAVGEPRAAARATGAARPGGGPGGRVAVAGVVGRASTRRRSAQPEPDEHLGPAALASEAWIEPSGWWWVVTRAPVTDAGGGGRRPRWRPGPPPRRSRRDDPAGSRGAWRRPLAVPHRGDQLGVVVAGLRSGAARRRWPRRRCRRPAVRRCAGTRRAPPRSGRRRCRRPGPCRSPGAQPLLELGHVVAAQHGGAAVEEAVAEATTGLDQGRPGLAAADPVDPQAPAVLERLDGGPCPRGSALGVDPGEKPSRRADAGRRPRRRPRRPAGGGCPDGLTRPPRSARPGVTRRGRPGRSKVGRRAPGAADPCPWPRRCALPARRP